MNVIQFIRLILRNIYYIMGAALLSGGVVLWITSKEKKHYASFTIINTGLVSGYSIESSQGGKTDYNYTNNELQNLIRLATARETILELSLYLMQHIATAGEYDSVCHPESYRYTIEALPSNITEAIRSHTQEDEALLFLRREYDKGSDNPIYKLAESRHELVGIEYILDHLKVTREGTSDMIRMEYKTIDPALCKQTLIVLTHIFVQKHQKIKESQSTSVLDFFEEATSKSARLLSSAERELLQFQENNRIINYYEQTRFISGKKEDLDERYQLERMNQLAADSSLRAIENQLFTMRQIPELHASLNRVKSDIERSLAGASRPLADVVTPLSTMQNDLKELAIKELKVFTSPEGLKGAALLEEWLEHKLLKHQSEARLSLMQERQREFDLLYDRFAPLGSKLKDIDRKIGIAEKEYLENLHSYNQARLHKYNMMMTTNLKVIDPPFKPVKPEKSKRVIMILLGTFSGLLCIVGVLVAKEMLDTSMRDMLRAGEATGLEVAGLIPMQKDSLIAGNSMNELSMAHIKNAIVLHLNEFPKQIVISSMHSREGKSTVADMIGRYLDADVVEWPALLQHAFNPREAGLCPLILLVCKAGRLWTEADRLMLQRLKKVQDVKVMIVLNGASDDAMEQWIGEVDKPRSMFRKAVKRLLKTGFSKSEF